MDNGDEITLTMYESYDTCENVFNCIAARASREEDTSVFILWHDDDSFDDEIQNQIKKYNSVKR